MYQVLSFSFKHKLNKYSLLIMTMSVIQWCDLRHHHCCWQQSIIPSDNFSYVIILTNIFSTFAFKAIIITLQVTHNEVPLTEYFDTLQHPLELISNHCSCHCINCKKSTIKRLRFPLIFVVITHLSHDISP